MGVCYREMTTDPFSDQPSGSRAVRRIGVRLFRRYLSAASTLSYYSNSIVRPSPLTRVPDNKTSVFKRLRASLFSSLLPG
jgi:hypothetical protein